MSFMSLSKEAKGVGIFVIIIAFVLAILQGLIDSGSLGTDTVAANAVVDGQTAVVTYISWTAILVLIGIGVYVFKRMSSFGN